MTKIREPFAFAKDTEGQKSNHFSSSDFRFIKRKKIRRFREGVKKKSIFLGKSPKLWVGGGQES